MSPEATASEKKEEEKERLACIGPLDSYSPETRGRVGGVELRMYVPVALLPTLFSERSGDSHAHGLYLL